MAHTDGDVLLSPEETVIELRGYLPFDMGDVRDLPAISGGYCVVPMSSIQGYADVIEQLIDIDLVGWSNDG